MRKYVSLFPCQRYMARAPSGLAGPPCIPIPLCSPTIDFMRSGLRSSISLGGYQSGNSFAAHSAPIAGCPATGFDMVEIVIRGIDHDRARRFLASVVDILAQKR